MSKLLTRNKLFNNTLTINNVEYKFLLDTGATSIVLNKKIWEDRGLLEVESINPLLDEPEQVQALETSDEA